MPSAWAPFVPYGYQTRYRSLCPGFRPFESAVFHMPATVHHVRHGGSLHDLIKCRFCQVCPSKVIIVTEGYIHDSVRLSSTVHGCSVGLRVMRPVLNIDACYSMSLVEYAVQPSGGGS